MGDVMDDVVVVVMTAMVVVRCSEGAERHGGENGGDDEFEAETRGTHGDSWLVGQAV
jgi:hypothetical protein